jgi:hypothetical protein
MDEKQKKDIRAGVLQGAAIAALVAALAAPVLWLRHAARDEQASAGAPVAAQNAAPRAADFGNVAVPDDIAAVAGWAVASGDTRTSPFALIDKRRTHLYVFDAAGRLRGHSPVLLGYAPGDHTVPGIGQRPIEQVLPSERTTPAGRFDVAYGRNLRQEDVVWVDYDAAVSMHRVLTTDPTERRLERLATPGTEDNRISYGCINVPVAFFEQVLWPTLGRRAAVVYVLPEVRPLAEVFPGAAAWSLNAGRPTPGPAPLA